MVNPPAYKIVSLTGTLVNDDSTFMVAINSAGLEISKMSRKSSVARRL